ncbi:MAG: glycosyltransferase family 2 protein [Synergistaceae bacterium]|nr:glycosyltransferase family 2 protein [Synergistaceae bacterium]
MKKLISVIAPMYNEQSLVQEYCRRTLEVLRQIQDYRHEIILVNDGSNDGTYDEMLRVHDLNPNEIGIISLSRNFGLEGAVNAGLRLTQGDIVVVMDADLQDPPELIPEMLRKIIDGADIVTASRAHRKHDSLWKRFSAWVYYKTLDKLSGKLKLERNAANFRMLTRRALTQLLELPESNKVFRVIVPYIGMKTASIEYDRDARFAGETKYNFAKMLRYALDSLAGISIEPLTAALYTIPAAIFVLVIALLGFIFSSASLWQAAWTVIFFCSFLAVLVLIVACLTGLYAGQIILEAKHRPISIIYSYIPANSLQEAE